MTEHRSLDEFLQAMRESSPSEADPRAALASIQSRVQQITDAFAEIHNGTYEGTMDDDDRVVAEVDGHGTLVRLEISPRAMRDMDATELSVACGQVITAARKTLAEALESATQQLADFDLQAASPRVDPRALWQRAREATGWQS